jgi:hypothetical protein
MASERLFLSQAPLRAVETCPSRLLAEPVEHRLHGRRVAATERPDEDLRAASGLHDTRVHAF